MNDIGALLAELDAVDFVRGVALVTGDGIAVKSALHSRFREDVVAGLASFLVQTTRRSMTEEGRDPPSLDRFVMHATHGKIVMAAVGDGWLIAITDQFAHLQDVEPAFDSVAARLRDAARLGK